jgi:hypothetical protein
MDGCGDHSGHPELRDVPVANNGLFLAKNAHQSHLQVAASTNIENGVTDDATDMNFAHIYEENATLSVLRNDDVMWSVVKGGNEYTSLNGSLENIYSVVSAGPRTYNGFQSEVDEFSTVVSQVLI